MATEKQAMYLRRLGYTGEIPAGIKEASDLITRLKIRERPKIISSSADDEIAEELGIEVFGMDCGDYGFQSSDFGWD